MSDNSAAIILESTTRIAETAALKEACDATACDLVIDASAVDSIDAAALQCLAAVRAHCTAMARGFVIRAPSTAFAAAARTSGFEQALGLAAEHGEVPPA
ncbi:MAG: STAS domain-containing protein [Gammaproteobacteria bacterium]